MAGTKGPITISMKQARIATLAGRFPESVLSTLAHHMDLEWLREAHRRTRKDGAVGIDGQTAREYAENLEGNLQSLLERAKSGLYRAPPVRRVYIPKGDGSKTRPLGIPTFEDKVLQRAVVMLLEPVYEQEFYDFSYGFRPRRSAHDAVEALDQHLFQQGGGWVLDVDIQGFFDTLDHGKLREILRHRVTDGVLVRLIGKWLRAGVMEDGLLHHSSTGSPQGGVISPLLSNIYLHAVLDMWWQEEVLPRLEGTGFLVRYADDFVMVFSRKSDAHRVQAVLGQRFARFGLTLHPEKTRLVYYHRPRQDGGGPPRGRFDFLGFTHYWGRSRRGKWVPQRKTAKGRFSRGLSKINKWMRRNRHLPVPEQSSMLGRKLRGYFNYYGIRGNFRSLSNFAYEVRCQWKKWLGCRSQLGGPTWEQFNALLERNPLPPPRLRRKNEQLWLANLGF